MPAPPENRVRRLSYSALALFEMCSYRFYAERIVGLRETKPALGDGGREAGLAATEIGDMAHVILEGLDLADPRPPDALAEVVRARYATATDEEVARIGSLVSAYCDSEIARRLAALPGATVERSFAFEHDGVLLHGRLDVFHEADGKALVVDYKTNVLEDASPDEVVEREYRLQRLVYALAALRAGADEVEVAYQFLERPDELVTASYKADEAPALEEELSRAIAAIQSGDFRPTPSEYACSTCPALNLVCAGPNLRARSFVSEARRRVGPKRDRILPIIQRLAAAHPDATIALRFRSDLELLVSVMLSAQTTDVNVNRVTETLFRKYKRPEDYLSVPVEELENDIRADRLLPPEDEVAPRDDEDADRGLRRRGPANARGADAATRRRAQDRERRRLRARRHAGNRRRHARPPTLPAPGADASGRSGEDRARPPAHRPARVLGRLSAPADLARPARLPRAPPALRGVRAVGPLSVYARRASATSRPPSSS